MVRVIIFLSGFILCLLAFSLTTSFLANLISFNRLSLGGHYGAFYIFIMFSPSTFGYYCIHYLVHYLKPGWDRRPKYALIYVFIAISYTYVFGFLFPIIGLISSNENVICQFLGIAIGSGVTFWFLRNSFEK